MSSELTIDIQLTELGFSSWDFQLLKQKDTPQTNGTASTVIEATTALSPPPSVESHEDEETNLLVDHDVSLNNADEPERDYAVVHTGNNDRHIGQQPRAGSEYDGEGEKQSKEDENRKTHEEHTSIRRTDGNWEIDVALCDEEENEDDDTNVTEDEDTDLSSDTNTSEKHRCHVCAATFSTPFLLCEHLHVHTGVRPYCCAECGKQFCHLANYRAHLHSHATFPCLICRARFATQELLQGHLDTNHFEKEFYQCDFCKRIFVSLEECEEHLQAHKKEVGRYPCPKCDRSFHQQSSLLCHLKWHKKSALICTDCGQAFPKKIALLRHSFVHLGLLPYTCVHCKRHFRLASLYHKHECKPEHIQCVACLVVFNSQDDFEKHKKDTGCWGHQMASPAKTKDIRCMECGQVFDSADELKKHAGTHQRVLKCSECGMGFRSSLLLMSHMGGHAAQRPCLCKQCGLGFPHQHSYDSHLKTCGLVTPPEVSVKKPKTPLSPKKKITMASKSKVLQAVSLEPQNVSQGVPLHPVAPTGNKKQPSERPWTLVLNKEHLPGNVPLVMLLPTPISTTSEGIRNPQTLVSSAAVSEKRLSVSHVINVTIPSTSQAPLASTNHAAKSDKPVVLQGLTSPGSNVLIPLTTSADSPRVRWTVFDQQTSGSVTNMHPMTKKNKTVMALLESKQTLNMSQVNAENEHKETFLLCPLSEVKLNIPSLSTAESHNPETPLCLVKVKTEPADLHRQHGALVPQESNSSLENADMKSADRMTDSNVLGSAAARVSGPSETKADISHFKTEPVPWGEPESCKASIPSSPDLISLHGSNVVDEDLCQCEICGIVLLEKDMSQHSVGHSVVSDSVLVASCIPRVSPSASPPCKRPNLG